MGMEKLCYRSRYCLRRDNGDRGGVGREGNPINGRENPWIRCPPTGAHEEEVSACNGSAVVHVGASWERDGEEFFIPRDRSGPIKGNPMENLAPPPGQIPLVRRRRPPLGGNARYFWGGGGSQPWGHLRPQKGEPQGKCLKGTPQAAPPWDEGITCHGALVLPSVNCIISTYREYTGIGLSGEGLGGN